MTTFLKQTGGQGEKLSGQVYMTMGFSTVGIFILAVIYLILRLKKNENKIVLVWCWPSYINSDPYLDKC